MAVVVFHTKYGDDIRTGESVREIMDQVLSERIEDTWEKTFPEHAGDSRSIWYDEDTKEAEQALVWGRGLEFMMARRDYEYEGYTIRSMIDGL